MKHKVSQLSGLLLDEAVAKVVGHMRDYRMGYYHPTVEWEECGPLISRFKINRITWVNENLCEVSTENEARSRGKNELEAICRVVVKTVCGVEIEL